jgi:hypothetical protein
VANAAAGDKMRRPSGDLLFYAAILIAGGVYLIARLSTVEPRFQTLSLALAAYVVAVAVLLLIRFRWSPELYVAVLVFMLGFAVVRGVAQGFDRNRIGISIGAGLGLFGYPTLRREIRGQNLDEAA